MSCLDYAQIDRAVAATVALGQGEAMLLSDPKSGLAIERRNLDAAIRADCELLAAWGPEGKDWREEMLKFVLNRRGVVEWPEWAAAWVQEGE